jgi:hypothetical protein
MSSAPARASPYDRVISITVTLLSLVLGLLPLIGVVVAMIRSFLYHDRLGMPPVIILIFAAGLIGISVTIFRGLRRREAFHWLGGGPLTYVLLLLIFFLSAMINAETTVIEHIMVRRLDVRPRIANLLAFLPVIAGALVFAFYWRRASEYGSANAK